MDFPGNLSSFSPPTPTPMGTNLSLGTEAPGHDPPPLSVFGVIVLIALGLLVTGTFSLNSLVLATIARVRSFHRVPYNLVASMAISDWLVAVLVMPLSLAYELAGRRWNLGRLLCHVWIACDVLCCTASIWNVTAIALDRYWSITRHVRYKLRTRKYVSNGMIVMTWALSAVIALSPLPFGWGEPYSEGDRQCQVSRQRSYAVVSTLGAFYVPLSVVLFVYWRIYKAAKVRLGVRKDNCVCPARGAAAQGACARRAHFHPRMLFSVRHNAVALQLNAEAWREHREQRAALMVGVLIGVFALCWIPFFATELIAPFCRHDLPAIWKSIFLWLGYSNSLFNPAIYLAFSRDFHSGIKRLFTWRRR